MEGISDIRIVGLDPRRPPVVRKEPYIDLFFAFSHQVPPDWAEAFNALLTRHKPPARVKPAEGLFIETWVRSPDHVVAQFETLRATVAECNQQYIARVLQRQGEQDAASSALGREGGEQGRLNRIIAGLEFDT